MPTVSLTSGSAASARVDALVVGVVPVNGDGGRDRRDGGGAERKVALVGAKDVDKAFKGGLTRQLQHLGATGDTGDVVKVASLGAVGAPVVVAVGLGREAALDGDAGYDPEALRRAAGVAARALAGTRRVALALPAETPATVRAVVEGALLGAYAFTAFRSSPNGAKPPVEAFTVLTPYGRDKAARAALDEGTVVAEAVNAARDLVNTPPGDLPPAALADAAVRQARAVGVAVEVLDEKALAKGGYGGIVGVGQGSSRPPRLVRLSYRGGGRKGRHLALVGKGITFDSGGLSLKPPQAMETMKCDMAGAAAVLGAVVAVARLELPVNVTAYLACAENLPSATAQRPSDVLRIYGGKTVEVMNTDAEGRLVMADALVRAAEDNPDLVIDVATLTGAQVVALGNHISAIMANDDTVLDGVHQASRRVGEAMWPMPLPRELRASLDSATADISNIGDRAGGMLVAGLFLRDFVAEGLRWAHLDIAGPAFNDGKPRDYTPKGGTGAAVRTLVEVARTLSAGEL